MNADTATPASALPPAQCSASESFTRADYAQLPEDFRAFLLEGQFVREAAPTWHHQEIVGALFLAAANAAHHRSLMAPADVVIDNYNVLQPDILVFGPEIERAATADPETVPVLVMEVLSPTTARRDRVQKTAHYLRAGVQEVWLVDPATTSIDVITAHNTTHYAADDDVVSQVVEGLRMTPRGVINNAD